MFQLSLIRLSAKTRTKKKQSTRINLTEKLINRTPSVWFINFHNFNQKMQ